MGTQRRAGRPTKKLPAVEQKLLRMVAKGHLMGDACRLAGIGTETLRQWTIKDPALAKRIEAARAKAVEYHLNLLHKAAPNDPKISTWFLERRYPEAFVKPEAQIGLSAQAHGWELPANQTLPLPKIALSEGEKPAREADVSEIEL